MHLRKDGDIRERQLPLFFLTPVLPAFSYSGIFLECGGVSNHRSAFIQKQRMNPDFPAAWDLKHSAEDSGRIRSRSVSITGLSYKQSFNVTVHSPSYKKGYLKTAAFISEITAVIS